MRRRAINAVVMRPLPGRARGRRRGRPADRRRGPWARSCPPLLGVPFTVKESIAVRGMPNAAGLVARRDYRSQRATPPSSSVSSTPARSRSAVTNTSELTLWIESENRLYGRTANPYDATRTAGGSSGGEGAAVGVGGSPFGLASDIAGSIRIPALFCGVFGHKPSSGCARTPACTRRPPATRRSHAPAGTDRPARRGPDAAAADHRRARRCRSARARGRARRPGRRSRCAASRSSMVEQDSLISDEPRAARRAGARGGRSDRRRARRCGAIAMRSWRSARSCRFWPRSRPASERGRPQTCSLPPASARPAWRGLLRRGGPHTVPTRLALAGRDAAGRRRLGRRRERLLARRTFARRPS